jgi:hypothetical protein
MQGITERDDGYAFRVTRGLHIHMEEACESQ